METTKIAVFKGKQIRKTIHGNEWWFSITDIIEALTGNERPRKYWNDLKKKLIKEGYFEVSEKIGQLRLQAPDGKLRLTDCADTETVFRIIQSVPSPKAEPFKRWLARVEPENGSSRNKTISRPRRIRNSWNEASEPGTLILSGVQPAEIHLRKKQNGCLRVLKTATRKPAGRGLHMLRRSPEGWCL